MSYTSPRGGHVWWTLLLFPLFIMSALPCDKLHFLCQILSLTQTSLSAKLACCPRSRFWDFALVTQGTRGLSEGWHQCLAVLLLYLPNSSKDTHKHPLPKEADKRCVSLVGRPGTRCHFLGKFLMQSSATGFWFLSKQDTECKFSRIRQLKILITQYTCHKSLTVQGRPQGWALIGCQNAG